MTPSPLKVTLPLGKIVVSRQIRFITTMEEMNMQAEGAAEEVTEQGTAEVAEQPATAEETSTEVASEEVAATEETSTPDETVSAA
ncbi:MAG: hypothetical protein PHG66_01185 [Candidatus Colwellbacteria bacterium]|nr:hypothetical protein [Candidatus Colwellbacteria bacterium]